MSLYARSRDSANRLIARYGQACTLAHVTAGTVSADGASRTGDSSANTTTKVVLLDYDDKLIDGTRIVQGDRRALLRYDAAPVIGDTITVGSEVLKAINVSPLNPGGTVIYYEAQVRR